MQTEQFVVTGGDDREQADISRWIRAADHECKQIDREESRGVIRRRREALGFLVAGCGVIGAFLVYDHCATFAGGVAFSTLIALAVWSAFLGVLWGQEA